MLSVLPRLELADSRMQDLELALHLDHLRRVLSLARGEDTSARDGEEGVVRTRQHGMERRGW